MDGEDDWGVLKGGGQGEGDVDGERWGGDRRVVDRRDVQRGGDRRVGRRRGGEGGGEGGGGGGGGFLEGDGRRGGGVGGGEGEEGVGHPRLRFNDGWLCRSTHLGMGKVS